MLSQVGLAPSLLTLAPAERRVSGAWGDVAEQPVAPGTVADIGIHGHPGDLTVDPGLRPDFEASYTSPHPWHVARDEG